MINTALVGYGYSAKTFHLPFISTNLAFHFCAAVSSQQAELTSDWPKANCYTSLDSMLKTERLDLVIITAPNEHHFELAKQCLLAGVNVVLEKPFVTNVAQGEQLIALAQQQGLILTVFHNRRWDGDFLTVQNLIAQKKLGDIRYFESHFDRFRPNARDRWRERPGQGTGIWYDLGPHLVDQALVLFGMPKSVTGNCRILRDNSAACDFFSVQLHYPHMEVSLCSSPFSASETLRFNLQGSLGNYVKQGLDPQEDALKGGLLPNDPAWLQAIQDRSGVVSLATENEQLTTESGNYSAFFNALAQAIEQGSGLPVETFDALQGLRIIEAAVASSLQQQTINL